MKLKMNCGISSSEQSKNLIKDELEKAECAIDNNVDYLSNISIHIPVIKDFWTELCRLNRKNTCFCSVPLYEACLFEQPIIDVIKRHHEEYGVKTMTFHMTDVKLIKRALDENFRINSRAGYFLSKSDFQTNPHVSDLEMLIRYCQKNKINIHIGTSLRPGKVDASPQINYLTLQELKDTRNFYDMFVNNGIETEIECMGHVSIQQLPQYKYFLNDREICSMGPLITDSVNEYDDLNAMFGYHLAAEQGMNIKTICIITRSEHIRIPDLSDDLDAIKKWQIYTYLYDLTHNTVGTQTAKNKELTVISKRSRQATQCSCHVNIFGEMNVPKHCNVCGDCCPLEMKNKTL